MQTLRLIQGHYFSQEDEDESAKHKRTITRTNENLLRKISHGSCYLQECGQEGTAVSLLALCLKKHSHTHEASASGSRESYPSPVKLTEYPQLSYLITSPDLTALCNSATYVSSRGKKGEKANTVSPTHCRKRVLSCHSVSQSVELQPSQCSHPTTQHHGTATSHIQHYQQKTHMQ